MSTPFLKTCRLFVFTLLLIVSQHTLLAQKRALSHDDYDSWKSISNTIISEKGNFVAYSIKPQKGDGKMYLHNLKDDKVDTFNRVEPIFFNSKEHFLVARVKPTTKETYEAKLSKKKKDELPKDSLLIIDLQSYRTKSFSKLKKIRYADEPEEWLGFGTSLLKTEQVDSAKIDSSSYDCVLLFNFQKNTIDTLLHVDEFSFDHDEKYFAFTTKENKKDSASFNSISFIDLTTGHQTILDSAHTSYKNVQLSKNKGLVAYLCHSDSFESAVPRYLLKLYSIKNKKQITSLDSVLREGPSLFISPEYRPSFSESTTELYFGLIQEPIKLPYEADTSILDEDRVSVDIWSWHDTDIQPVQIKNQKADRKKSILCRLDLKSLKVVQLASDKYHNLQPNLKSNAEQLILFKNEKYKKERSWNSPWTYDIYLVNKRDGKEQLVAEKIGFSPGMSPGGSFVHWYDHISQTWMVYDIRNDITHEISHPKGEQWNNFENDRPMADGPFGYAGWTERDESFWIYDEFDIWAFYPKTKLLKRITLGRSDQNVYRHIETSEEDYISNSSPEAISIFNKISKNESIITIRNARTLDTIVPITNHSLRSFTKAPEAEVFLYRKGNFKNYPELYLKSGNKTFELSLTNPQQESFRWGDVEIIDYRSRNGEKRKALLFTPEDLDKSKQYPLMVYFYERYTDRLNTHRTPSPSASTINIPYFLSNEYVVLIPDIHYTEGQPGQDAFDCIMGAVDEVVSYDFIDSTNMAIQGQSWGGYQVAYLVTQTNRFKAAMAGAPVSNMTSAYGGIRWGSGYSRMFQYERTQSRLGGTLWEYPDRYIKNSPLFYSDRVETPLLIMHNDEDGAVPWYQGIEYFLALRRLEKPAWMLVYNGEAHNLVHRKNRVDLSIRMSQFFDHYLKGDEMPEWMKNGLPAEYKGRALGY